MKTKLKLSPFYLHGLNQTPKDLDFNITPTLVFAYANPEEIGELGWAIALGFKWGFWAVGIKLFGAYYE